jgi:Protein of unknown function (DUF2637)
MSGTDRYRTLTAAAVLLVAAIAAVISYQHVVALAIRYGQPSLAAYLLPVSIDGLVAVSSRVMLRAARIGVSAPWLARTGLVLAVIATLACNVGYGVAHGWPGALLSGWPAVAFVVAAETAITMTRQRPAGHTAPATDTAVPEVPAGLNGHADRAAEIFAEDLARGDVPGVRRIRREMHLGQPRAQQVREYLSGLASSNGHLGGDA